MSWTYLVADKRAGSVRVISPNTEEHYEITQWGTWVPTEDVKQLLVQERDVCCDEGHLIRIVVFARGNPTEDQMKDRPIRPPRYKQSKPGLKKRKRRRRS